MINISKLYCDEITPGDWIRYGRQDKDKTKIVPKSASERRPIVVWNITRACNLKCIHCYNDSGAGKPAEEISSQKAKAVLDDLAQFGVPSVLFSGGEPLMRADLFELLEYAGQCGLRTVISTNGTLITKEIAQKINKAGVTYVGISLDGIGDVNDRFRGVSGAFELAVSGIRNVQQAGVRVGLRLTMTKRNIQDLERWFDFFEAENIERACFYHFVPSGRGGNIQAEALTHPQSRQAVETILQKTRQFRQAGRKTDILTVDNHVDGVYLYLRLLDQDPKRAEKVWELLCWNGGGLYSSGVGIGCIDYNGKVHPDQFWGHYELGDINQKPFSSIWTYENEPLLKGLRNRRANIKGRCRLCKFFDACGGSLRVRADLHFGDPWAPEPACYLTDEEIGLGAEQKVELAASGDFFKMP